MAGVAVSLRTDYCRLAAAPSEGDHDVRDLFLDVS